LVAGLERQLAEVDQRFVDLAAEGDLRAQAVATAIDRVRRELDGLGAQQAASGGTLEDLTHRAEQLRGAVASLQRECGEELTGALGSAEGGAERLLAAVQAARPDIERMSEAAETASTRLQQGSAGLSDQQERLTTLLATVDSGVGSAEQRLADLTAALASAGQEAGRLQAETGPALVQAMVQIREAAAQAATRAREALASVVPHTAEQLSLEARAALSRAVEESVREQLGEVERVAARALDAARQASAGLSQQMLNIGRTASALEQHLEKVQEDDRLAESEAFARRASVLIDSLHSASIDVGRILSDEVDDRAWAAYLKGDRGVFTRKAVRLLSSGELRLVDQQFAGDPEFAASVTRYVRDFEAMLRRVSAEQEGGMMAVTLLSSDMGRLYTALAQVVERRR
jgi:chromosome segregation ATPase